jgi:hypothetical protein
MSEILSKEKQINKIYSQIAGVPDPESGIAQPETGIAQPGDLVFLITHYPCKTLKSEITGKGWREAARLRLRARWRGHLGFDRDDWDDWHVAIYFEGRKRKGHIRVNPYIIHATEHKGVQINQISPGGFTNESPEVRTRMEIMQFEGIRNEQRKEIIDFSLSKLGLAFDGSVGRHARLTYAFGLPNVLHKRNELSCQQLVIDAYAAAEIFFPHPYKSFPIFNIGRCLGHPLGHPKDRVDPSRPYLLDHHIYRDPRFVLKAVVYQDAKTGEIRLETKDLQKYSWNKALKERYLARKYISNFN